MSEQQKAVLVVVALVALCLAPVAFAASGVSFGLVTIDAIAVWWWRLAVLFYLHSLVSRLNVTPRG